MIIQQTHKRLEHRTIRIIMKHLILVNNLDHIEKLIKYLASVLTRNATSYHSHPQ